MKILTLIMAIMMPLTIVTGFYGMNVKLPFQENPHAWIGIIALMFIASIIMYFLFRKIKIKPLNTP
jgi:magnesium transporter